MKGQPRISIRTTSALAEAWLNLGRKKPAAIIALNDRLALAMISTLRSDKIFAPDDFAIVGYDATELGMFCDPALTTIDRSVRFRIAPKLIVRASTGQSVLSEEATTKRN